MTEKVQRHSKDMAIGDLKQSHKGAIPYEEASLLQAK